ncbi:hypothetical protein AB2871_24780, partial [Escherichia coli]
MIVRLPLAQYGYSQKAIAVTLEVSTRTIRNWKSGKHPYPIPPPPPPPPHHPPPPPPP